MSNNLITLSNRSELDVYLAQVSKVKLLTEQEELDLANQFYYKKDKAAANKLVVSHLPLVVKIAYSYKGYGLPLIDLISEGNIGLMKAITKFDPTKGYRLSTYAIWWIKAYMADYILNSWSLVKTTTLSARKKLFFSLNKIKKQLNISSTSLSNEEASLIAKESGVSKGDVLEVNNMIYARDAYLDSTLGSDENSSTLGDVIPDLDLNPEEKYMEKEKSSVEQTSIKQVLEVLDSREKEIIVKRYMQTKPVSLEVLGKALNISRERVRQIEVKALKKAKKFLETTNKDLVSNYSTC